MAPQPVGLPAPFLELTPETMPGTSSPHTRNAGAVQLALPPMTWNTLSLW